MAWVRKSLIKGAPFLLAFLLLRFAGVDTLVHAVSDYVFPEAASFGSAEIGLVPFHAQSSATTADTTEPIRLLLLKHDKERSQKVTVVTRSAALRATPLFVGSLGNEPLPRLKQGGLPPTRVLLEAELPAESLLGVGSHFDWPGASADNSYAYRTDEFVAEADKRESLSFKTKNEERELRVFYWTLIGLLGGVALTVGRRGPLLYHTRGETGLAAHERAEATSPAVAARKPSAS